THVSAPEQLRHFSDLHFEQLAEQWTDVDAGKKIARASGSPGRAGVVAGVGIVKSKLHERGNRYRATFLELLNQRHFRVQISDFRFIEQSEINLKSELCNLKSSSVLLDRDEHFARTAPDEDLRHAARLHLLQ